MRAHRGCRQGRPARKRPCAHGQHDRRGGASRDRARSLESWTRIAPPAASSISAISRTCAVWGPKSTGQPKAAGSRRLWPPTGTRLPPDERDGRKAVQTGEFPERVHQQRVRRLGKRPRDGGQPGVANSPAVQQFGGVGRLAIGGAGRARDRDPGWISAPARTPPGSSDPRRLPWSRRPERAASRGVRCDREARRYRHRESRGRT